MTTEISLILDDNLTELTKARTIKNLFNVLIEEISAKGFEDTHVFVLPETDERYADFLQKHFNFVKTTGIPMYKRA